MQLQLSSANESLRDKHERTLVLREADRTLVALVSGSGGLAATRHAGERTLDELSRCFQRGTLPDNPEDWEMVLEGIDQIVLADPDAGETSVMAMQVERGFVVGASVGASSAWVMPPGGDASWLTKFQRKTPRIGTGMAIPIGFGPVSMDGKLVAVPDDLADYVHVGQASATEQVAAAQASRARLLGAH